ncbi:hypothetical protein MATL_G00186720 [Megalops atlanticus]|uniref:G protein-regulated inducer of neurite outgrowth C-terminal domain-containing protein n=1 Tax=Megalops atlanticus TaxID=7932 RepID=A0A9D3PQA8_MEGAT|nr:hypothetical protein MATL_G00186720 [Megalops atlanticus]
MSKKALPMAESARPVSELFPPGGAAASGADNTSDSSIFPLSKSSMDVVTGPLCQEELRKSLSSAACSRTSVDSGGLPPLPPSASNSQEHSSGPGTPETVIHRDAERPCSIAEIPWTEPPPAGEVAGNSHPSAGEGAAAVSPQGRASSSSHTDLRDERLEPVQQPVQRSLSASLRTAREGPAPRRSETSAACPRAGYCGRDTAGCPGLVCKHPSNSSGEGEAKQLSCGGEACYGPLVNHGGLEDTFAAYCHPLPIPTPAQLLPRLVGAEGERGGQRAPAHAGLLTFPRLISSVSETGLDAKRMMRCCNADCQEQGAAYPIPLPPGGPQGAGRATREAGTMTSRGELRDVGVQTELSETPPPHVYPEVSVAVEEGDAGPGAGAGGQKSPVKEVMWDAEGMTWEVYGASVDPEELGLAIQKHLELQIKEKAARATKLSRQDTPTSQRSGRRRKRGGVLGSLRNPSCCARSSAVVD